ncbi:hypothetical protein K501DRAFT_267710 [Backusella circina FSU 941]|nr:hypothetical protein K501DRAFT_267710 [Backusella circina FSU 941]
MSLRVICLFKDFFVGFLSITFRLQRLYRLQHFYCSYSSLSFFFLYYLYCFYSLLSLFSAFYFKMTLPTAVNADDTSVRSENIALQEQVKQLLSEKAAWALQKEQLTKKITSLKAATSKKISDEQQPGKKYNDLLVSYRALKQRKIKPVEKVNLYIGEILGLSKQNDKLKKQLTKINDDLVYKHKKELQIVQDELKKSKEELFNASKTICDLTSQSNNDEELIKSQQDEIEVLDMTRNTLEDDKLLLTKEIAKLKKPEYITNQEEFSQLNKKFEELQDKFCHNKDELATNNYKRLLKKVSVSRAKDWNYAIKDLKSSYVDLGSLKQVVLHNLSESNDTASQSTHLIGLIETERREKERLWDLYTDRMNTADALNEELLDSQKEVAQLKSENKFIHENVVVFGKRKRCNDDENDDEDTLPKKKNFSLSNCSTNQELALFLHRKSSFPSYHLSGRLFSFLK